MLVQQRPSWTCKNPRCFEQITWGSYCSPCLKLVQGRKIPDSIICSKCNKEVKVKQITNEASKKKTMCDECHHKFLNERSLNYYYTVTRKRKLETFLGGNV